MSGAPARSARPFAYWRIWWLGSGILAVQLAFATYNAFLPLLYREFIDSRALVGLRALLQQDQRGSLLVLGSLLVTYVGFAGLQAMFPIYGWRPSG